MRLATRSGSVGLKMFSTLPFHPRQFVHGSSQTPPSSSKTQTKPHAMSYSMTKTLLVVNSVALPLNVMGMVYSITDYDPSLLLSFVFGSGTVVCLNNISSYIKRLNELNEEKKRDEGSE